MTKQELIDWAIAKGWEKDRWGHLKKFVPNPDGGHKTYRLKLQDKSVRYEVASGYTGWSGHIQRNWIRLRSGYYGKLSIVNDKLAGMR